jgi:TPR repeat protein
MNIFAKMKFKRLTKKLAKLREMREKDANVDLKNEMATQVELAKFYDTHLYVKKLPQAELYAMECYRQAAALGDVSAQYICGMRLFTKARFWDEWSKGIYGMPIHEQYAQNYYDEALTYLKEAEANGHPLAKRHHGLALVRGWGVEKNLEGGFKLIVESIEQQGAWNRVTKVFEELGLNSPEFFNMLVYYRPTKS